MRNLERELAKLARKAVKQILTGKAEDRRDDRGKRAGFPRRAEISAMARPKPRIRSAS